MASNSQNVPRKEIPEARTAVHRPSDSSADPSSLSSNHQQAASTQHHIDHNRANTPPPYSAPTDRSLSSQVLPPAKQPIYPGLPRLDYRLYSPPTFTLSTNLTTITSNEPQYSTSSKALMSLVRSLATVPPKPTIRIQGNRGDTIDFDVRVNCMNLFSPEDHGKNGRSKNSMNYLRVIGPGEKGWRGEGKETTGPTRSGLESWCQAFCEDPATIKTFALNRQVTNWDTSYLSMRLLALTNTINYEGKVTITFPLTHCTVLVQSPDKVNRFFSNVTKIFTGTKRYEVVESIWPYADVARGVPGRKVQVQDEEEWFDGWKDAIRHAVVMKRKGWCTVEDRLEFLMEPRDSGPVQR